MGSVRNGVTRRYSFVRYIGNSPSIYTTLTNVLKSVREAIVAEHRARVCRSALPQIMALRLRGCTPPRVAVGRSRLPTTTASPLARGVEPPRRAPSRPDLMLTRPHGNYCMVLSRAPIYCQLAANQCRVRPTAHEQLRRSRGTPPLPPQRYHYHYPRLPATTTTTTEVAPP